MTISNGTYIIRSVHSQAHRLHKDDESSAIVNDTANDTWIVTKNVAGGFYTITHNHSTPEACLDLAGQNTTPGTDIIVHPKNSSKAQEWEITEVTAGKYNIIYHAHHNRAMVTRGTGVANCHIAVLNKNSTRQQWIFESA